LKHRAIHLVALTVVFAMILAACSSNDSVDTTTTAAAEETTTTVAAVEETTTAAAVEETTTTAAEDVGDMDVACDEPVKVGVITDQTGALAIYGAHIMRSFPHGMEYATGAPGENDVYTLGDCQIDVIYKDDQSDPEATATLARELIEADDVDVIVGSVSPGATIRIQELALANDVIHIAAPASANYLTGATFNPNSFRTSRNNYQDAASLCEYLQPVYETFVQIAPDYSFGYGNAQAFRDACTVEGGEFVAEDIFAPLDTTDFTPYMEEILDSGADSWIVTWAGGGFIPMMQAATDLGVVDEMALATSFVDNQVMPTFFANLVGTTSGILYHYTLPNNEINDWLVAKTQEVDGTFPDLFDADGMNAAIMIVEALKATGGDASADVLRSAMEGMSFQGPKGQIDIRAEDHVAMQDMYIVTLTNLDDPEFKFFELVTTNRPDVPCLLEGDYANRCGSLPVGSLGG